ncbi:MAG: uncharacterized protein KVP18_001875 [Porospora cf. gigantea A]|uniref:uncharacterized protein n=1 Tax=Porospora cf. gigantea A TaxID=2853593 RepID=UPI00355A9BCF|nr:MAG: hypothetical protein KVP18_001875 [Porospora cf. gigantea A]
MSVPKIKSRADLAIAHHQIQFLVTDIQRYMQEDASSNQKTYTLLANLRALVSSVHLLMLTYTDIIDGSEGLVPCPSTLVSLLMQRMPRVKREREREPVACQPGIDPVTKLLLAIRTSPEGEAAQEDPKSAPSENMDDQESDVEPVLADTNEDDSYEAPSKRFCVPRPPCVPAPPHVLRELSKAHRDVIDARLFPFCNKVEKMPRFLTEHRPPCPPERRSSARIQARVVNSE